MASSGYWAGDAIATSMKAAADRERANVELGKAERYHAGTLAVLNAALAELRRVDPGNPLLLDEVQQVIDAAGEDAYRRTNGFQAVHALELDPAAILKDLQADFESRRTEVLAELEDAPIVETTRSTHWWAIFSSVPCWNYVVVQVDTPEEAERVKAVSISLARCAKLGDTLDPKALVLAASKTQPAKSGLAKMVVGA